MINIEVKGKIRFPELKFQKELKEIADNVFIPFIQQYIVQETNIMETPYPPLAASTLKRKKGRILYETGALYRSFYSIARGVNEVVIKLASGRSDIGYYLQKAGIRSKMYGKRYFNFFGISTRMNAEAINYMKTAISKELKK